VLNAVRSEIHSEQPIPAIPSHMQNSETANSESVFISSRDDQCPKCGQPVCQNDYITFGDGKLLCARCVGIDTLVFLGSGDVALTRRAAAHTGKKYPVFKFNRTRKRNERQGVLVTQVALDLAKLECEADAADRERKQAGAAKRRDKQDVAYRATFARRIRELYPSAPVAVEVPIAEHACKKYSGRVGRSAAAKELLAQYVDLAVRAHIRHALTAYDQILAGEGDREDARAQVIGKVNEIAAQWKCGRFVL